MARVGKIHMLNNYYTCIGSGYCINPRKNSEFLIEGNYFAKGVSNIYGQTDAIAVTWRSNNYAVEHNSGTPSSFGTTVTVPYDYTVAAASDIPEEVGTHAGATLFTRTEDQTKIKPVQANADDGSYYNLTGQSVNACGRGIFIVNHRLIMK